MIKNNNTKKQSKRVAMAFYKLYSIFNYTFYLLIC